MKILQRQETLQHKFSNNSKCDFGQKLGSAVKNQRKPEEMNARMKNIGTVKCAVHRSNFVSKNVLQNEVALNFFGSEKFTLGIILIMH